jgi:excinuclease ABC subunit C
MAVFTNGEKDSKRTRLFKIRGISKGDDYAALCQTLLRRLTRAKEENDLPDLIMIDGGKGQLNIALDVLRELDIATVDAISLTKEEGKHTKGMTAERIFTASQKEPISLDNRSPLLFLLQRIRDEAHRKAIGFHKKKRSERLLKSALDDIPGIGPIKKKRLLHRFGSVERIRTASTEDLLSVKGVTKKDVEKIKNSGS